MTKNETYVRTLDTSLSSARLEMDATLINILNIKENLAEVDSDRSERGKHDDTEKCECGDARGLFLRT